MALILDSQRLPRSPLPRIVQQLVTNPPPRTPLPRTIQRKVSEPASLWTLLEVQALLLQVIGHFWSQQLWTLPVGWTLEQMTWRSLGFFWVS